METLKYLGHSDIWYRNHLAKYLNTMSSDSPMYEKAEKSLAFIANRIRLNQKIQADTQRDYANLLTASKTKSK